jgi:hypothetical protein
LPRVFRVLGVVVIEGISRRILIAIAVAVIGTPTATAIGAAAAGTAAAGTAATGTAATGAAGTAATGAAGTAAGIAFTAIAVFRNCSRCLGIAGRIGIPVQFQVIPERLLCTLLKGHFAGALSIAESACGALV